jgi:hypothetical protein
MRRLMILLAVMGAMCALSAGAALAQAESETIVDRQPFEATVSNPCNGEFIPLTGHFTTVYHVTTNDNGEDLTVISQQTFIGSGVGEITGARYQVNNTSHASITLHQGSTFTSPYRLIVIGEGQAPDFRMYGLAHYTVTSNGLVVGFSDFSYECKV